MKLPSFKRLYESDFSEEDQELIKTLASSYNGDMENIYLALSKRISLLDNIQCTVKIISTSVDSNGIPLDSTSFKISKQGGTQVATKIIGCPVFAAVNLTNNQVYPTAAPFISFSQNEDIITINHIAGLPANNVFQITLIAYN